MKNTILALCLLVVPAVTSESPQGDIPPLTGPYLGQKPPGIRFDVMPPGLQAA